MTEERRQMFCLLRRTEACGRGLSPKEKELLDELETEYVGKEIIPVLRDQVRPLVEAFGAPLRVSFEIDPSGQPHYSSFKPSVSVVWPEMMIAAASPALAIMESLSAAPDADDELGDNEPTTVEAKP